MLEINYKWSISVTLCSLFVGMSHNCWKNLIIWSGRLQPRRRIRDRRRWDESFRLFAWFSSNSKNNDNSNNNNKTHAPRCAPLPESLPFLLVSGNPQSETRAPASNIFCAVVWAAVTELDFVPSLRQGGSHIRGSTTCIKPVAFLFLSLES
jgi:hypothetical protein